MPEKCLFCGEHAVIEESVAGGTDQRVCVECGSLAGVSTLEEQISFKSDSDLLGDNSPVFDENAVDADSNPICQSCGVTLDDSDAPDLCADCVQENTKEANSSHNSLPHSNHEDEKQLQSYLDQPLQGLKCISCNSHDVFLESIHGDERLICSSCGNVNSNVELTSDEYCPLTRTKSNNVLNLPRFGERNRYLEGLKAGNDKIKLLCVKYCFTTDVRYEAEEIFRKLFYRSETLHATIVKKESLAAACLFLVCRRNDFPISLTLFKEDVAVFKSFSNAVRHTMKVLGLKLPHMSIVDQLTEFLTKFTFGKEIIEKVKDILFLFRKAWLTQGRSRMGLISIAVYHAYLSSDKCPRFMTFKSFCNLFKIPFLSSSLARECGVLLLKLAQSLPWVSKGAVHAKNLYLYINEILKYQESVFHLAFTSDDADNDESRPTLNDQEPNIPRKSVKKRKEVLLPSASKKKKMTKDEPIHEETLPPPGIDLDSTELKETEFEEEINSYLLSSEEQAVMKKDKLSLWK